MKKCSRCKVEKPFSEFFVRKDSTTGYGAACKECQRVYEIARNLRDKFGLTIDEYNAMLVVQRGVCKLCEQPETSKNKFGVVKRLAVHHFHETGEVICLLCYRCNTALGMLNDDPELLQKAADLMLRFKTTGC